MAQLLLPCAQARLLPAGLITLLLTAPPLFRALLAWLNMWRARVPFRRRIDRDVPMRWIHCRSIVIIAMMWVGF